jgi:hypothetical protein
VKLWKVWIILDNGNTVIKFDKKLSLTEINRVTELLAGGRHVHRNPKRKPRNERGFPYCAPMVEKEVA